MRSRLRREQSQRARLAEEVTSCNTALTERLVNNRQKIRTSIRHDTRLELGVTYAEILMAAWN